MASRLDIIIFGATGFTGKFTLPQLHQLAAGHGRSLTWGVAGRSEQKLRSVLAETSRRIGTDMSHIPVIIADVNDEESVKQMTAGAKVVINCCGPFLLYGEVVVKSCIETSTHYVDVTAETQFTQNIVQKYSKAAEEKGVYIVNGCGYDNVVADLGVGFLQKHFEGTLNSVEVYMHFHYDDECRGPQVNYGTWASIIQIVENHKSVVGLARNLFSNPFPESQPKLHFKFLPHKIDNKWAIPLPTADRDTVLRSELYFHKHHHKRPVQMHFYYTLHSLFYAVLFILGMFVANLICRFKCGTDFLLKHPRLLSKGFFCNNTTSPSEETIKDQRFWHMLYGKGWSEKLAESEDEYKTPPNKMIVGRVSGVNPGYDFTCVAVALSAIMILTEPRLLPEKGGVYTPASAFSRTSFVSELEKNRTVFEVVAVKDI